VLSPCDALLCFVSGRDCEKGTQLSGHKQNSEERGYLRWKRPSDGDSRPSHYARVMDIFRRLSSSSGIGPQEPCPRPFSTTDGPIGTPRICRAQSRAKKCNQRREREVSGSERSPGPPDAAQTLVLHSTSYEAVTGRVASAMHGDCSRFQLYS
jgi:hypothetical protein